MTPQQAARLTLGDRVAENCGDRRGWVGGTVTTTPTTDGQVVVRWDDGPLIPYKPQQLECDTYRLENQT